MVRATVSIFDHEDRIVAETREKFGFKNKNEALNFIIRKFEKHLKEVPEQRAEELLQDLSTLGMKEKEKVENIFQPSEEPEKRKRQVGRPKKTAKTKKLKTEKAKQSLASLKNILSER